MKIVRHWIQLMGATYKGTAIGRVYSSIKCDGCSFDNKKAAVTAYGVTVPVGMTEDQFNEQEVGKDIAKLFATREATMQISKSGNKTVQTLSMPFYTNPVADKFYDVTITKTGNGDPTMTFRAGANNYTDDDVSNAIAPEYRMYGADSHWDLENASFNPGYYGVNTGNEAAGTAEIRASQNNDKGYGEKRDYEVQAAWGLKVQPQP